MKRTLLFTLLLGAGVTVSATAQSSQSPTMQQSTSTVQTPPTSQPKPKLKKPTRQQRQRMNTGLDTTLPKDRNQRLLPPDSLRRGGATKVDTI